MPIQPALTSPEQTALNGAVGVKTYLSFIPRGVALATATVQVNALDPTETILTTSASANWLQAKKNMMVVIMDSTNTTVKTVTRLRLDNSSTAGMDIQQTALADPGLIPQDIRTTSIVAGDLIFIYSQTFAPFVIPSRIFFSGGLTVFYKDTSIVYTNQNSLPPPILKMNIYKPNGSNPDIYLGNHAAVFVDDNQTYATLKLKVDYQLWPTSSSITGYTGTLPGATVTSGSLNSNAATVQLPKGTYLWTMTVADNNSQTTTGYRLIRVHDSTDMPLPIVSVSSDVRDQSGRRVTLQLNDNVLSNIPDGSMCILWNEVWVNGVKWGVPTMTTQFVGWLFHTEPNAENGLRQANCEIVGPQGLMAKMGNVSQFMEVKSSPATWAEFIPDLANIRYLIFYLLKYHSGNILDLFDLNLDTTSNLTGRRTTQSVAAAALYDQCNNLAKTIKCNFGCDSSGSIYVQPIPQLQPYPRMGVGTRDVLNAGKVKNYTLPRRQRPEIGMLIGQGFYSNGIKDFPVKSNAPGAVRSQGTGEQQAFYTVDSANDLQVTIGMDYAMQNSLYDDGNATIEQNRDVYEPAQMQFVQQTIPTYADPYGVGFTKNTIIKSVTKTYYSQGYADIALTYAVETSGLSTPIIPIVTPPVIQPTPPAPPTTGTSVNCSGTNFPITLLGDCALVFDNTNIRLVKGIQSGTITSIALSTTGIPTGGKIARILPDPFGSWWNTHTGAAPAYCLANGGVYKITDIFDCTKSWTIYQSLTNSDVNAFPAVMRVSHAVSGDVYVMYSAPLSGIGKEVARITSGGIAWSMDLSVYQFDPLSAAMDIDQNGADEMWVCLVGEASHPIARVIQILNGVATTKNSFNWAFRDKLIPLFLQKPQLTTSGLPNTSTSTPTILISMTGNDDRPNIALSTDGFATYTEIGPTPHLSPGNSMSSMIADDNPNIVISSVVPFSTYDSCTAPSSGCSTAQGLWFSTTGSSGGWIQASGSTQANAGNTCGYFPTKVAGQYLIYTGGTSKMGYMFGLTGTFQSLTPDWTVSGGIYGVIPIS